MKESTLVEMKNKVETLGRVLQQVTIELTNLKDLSIGTMELVKRFDGYDDALTKLKEEHGRKQEAQSDSTSGADSSVVDTNE